jgi:5-methylcytosine-specific restriction endonuclease McrA
MKTCAFCKKTKDFSLFSQYKGKSYYYSYCKECSTLKGKEWREKNKEKSRACKGKWQANNPQKKAISQRLWLDNNAAIHTAKEAKRRATKLNATPKWVDLNAIKTEYQLAKWCSDVTGEFYHVDHIIPLNGNGVCGLHVPWNLQILPAKINLQKGNRYE